MGEEGPQGEEVKKSNYRDGNGERKERGIVKGESVTGDG